MRIGLIADTVNEPGGIGRYTRELLAGLARTGDVSLVVCSPDAGLSTVERLVGDRLDAHISMPASSVASGIWVRHSSGRRLASQKVDVVHATKHLVPRTTLPTVLTVHDVLTITRRRENPILKRILLPRQYMRSMHEADLLVSVSGATRDRLLALEPTWASKTIVISEGASRALFDAAPTEIPNLSDFALVIGDVIPRKNLNVLIDAWPEVVERGGPHLLVIGVLGPRGRGIGAALEDLEERQLATWIRGAEDGQLRWSYEHARVVLLPSFEEGFGLPLVEARAFGATVITSTDRALVEVADGDSHVIHISPSDRNAWRDAILATSPRAPTATVDPGPDWHSWDRHAAAVIHAYRDLTTTL